MTDTKEGIINKSHSTAQQLDALNKRRNLIYYKFFSPWLAFLLNLIIKLSQTYHNMFP